MTAPLRALPGGLLRSLPSGLLDAVLPLTCCACGVWIPARSEALCDACRPEVERAAALPYCPRCGRTAALLSLDHGGCARCRSESAWNLASVVRLGPYQGALRQLVLDLKYRGATRNADLLAKRLAAALARRGFLAAIDVLTPVPMHWLRRWQRPEAHADRLAEALGRRTGLPVWRAARRVRYRPSQTEQPTRTARIENVRGCFAPRPASPAARFLPWLRRDLSGRTVCIVDNLMTTGATVQEVARVLRAAGAHRIFAAIIARSTTPTDEAGALAPRGTP